MTAEIRANENDFDKMFVQERDIVGKHSKENLAGLAFSGGGIRSATFNLGIIQSLARHKLLEKFDYLSTVSGGGYIGSWLSAQIYRHTGAAKTKIEGFQELLKESLESGKEPESVNWLRNYSNYLTPKKGLTGDTLAAIGTWLRNTLLNQTALGLLFISSILFLQLIPLTLDKLGWLEPLNSCVWLLTSVVSIFVGIFLCAGSLPQLRCCDEHADGTSSVGKEWEHLAGLIVFIAVVTAYCLSIWMYSSSVWTGLWLNDQQPLSMDLLISLWNSYTLFGTNGNVSILVAIQASPFSPLLIPVTWAILYTLPWLISMLFTWRTGKIKSCANPEDQHASTKFGFALTSIISTLISGALGGWLIYLLSQFISQKDVLVRLWWASGIGPPLLLLIFCTVLTLHQGIMARMFRVSQMEWWARLGGYVLMVALAWAGIYALLIYSPALINMLESWLIAGGIVWIAHSLTGAILGKGTGISGQDSGIRWKEWITIAAPYVFVLGYLVLASWIVHFLMFHFGTKDTPSAIFVDASNGAFGDYLSHALQIKNNANISALWYALAGCGIAFVLLAIRLDVNLFSIHHFYRNRLTRCYLGAGRGDKRKPNLFTGFDPCDDIRIADLKHRPLHLVNTAINLVHYGKLAWQDRKAYSFTFSPVACGFQYPQNSGTNGGYCDTAKYMGGVKLGTAMAASGAAASPNMGYHSSPAVTFLLTVFNVRLGHWCPNTKTDVIKANTIKRESPANGSEYLFKELFGLTDDENDFVYLSDGGHFENLGVYELVRRRCRHIMVVDAGQDKKRNFEDLANLIRKCYIDFGVIIDIKLDSLRADSSRISKSCHQLGTINYPDCDYRGVLLYVKPSLMKDIPEDIRQYAAMNDSFPHQSTGDQFFDEDQFESYRHIGEFLMETVLGELIPTYSAENRDAANPDEQWGLFHA